MAAAAWPMFWRGGTKMSAYFSASMLAFIPEAWKADGTYSDETWPADAVLLTDEIVGEFWKCKPPEGKMLGESGGQPAWVDIPPPPPMSRDEVDAARLREYSNPITGSDRLFAEASRMDIMGEPDFEAVRASAIARYQEIQAANPWPDQ